MDPNSGRIYDEKEIEDLPPEIRERLIHGTREELERLQAHIYAEGAPKPVEVIAANGELDVQQTAEELEEILEAMANIKEMPDGPPEKFYPINRAARRAAEKRERKQKPRFVNKPGYGKVKDHG